MSTTAEPANTPAKTKKQASDYVVLAHESTSDIWKVVAIVPARSAHEAIRHVSDGKSGPTYVAVPERSWRPVKVKTETRTVLKLETA